MYQKEGILVHSEDTKAEFSNLKVPKLVIDDPVPFPNVARLPHAMLRQIDPEKPNFGSIFSIYQQKYHGWSSFSKRG